MRREPFKHCPYVNSSLRSLLQGLLEKDAKKRFSAQQAAEHEWFQEGMRSTMKLRETLAKEAALSGSLASISEKTIPTGESSLSVSGTGRRDTPTAADNESIMKRAMTFRQATQFEKAIMSIAAYQEASEEIDILREHFISLDTAGNGTLSKAELAKGIKEAGVDMSSQEINKLFEALDADRTGKVHFCEFLAGTLNPAEVATDKAINDVFNFFDLDRSGRVNRHELCEVLGDEAEASSLLRKAKTPGKDYLSKDDFARVMKEIARNMEARYSKLEASP